MTLQRDWNNLQVCHVKLMNMMMVNRENKRSKETFVRCLEYTKPPIYNCSEWQIRQGCLALDYWAPSGRQKQHSMCLKLGKLTGGRVEGGMEKGLIAMLILSLKITKQNRVSKIWHSCEDILTKVWESHKGNRYPFTFQCDIEFLLPPWFPL